MTSGFSYTEQAIKASKEIQYNRGLIESYQNKSALKPNGFYRKADYPKRKPALTLFGKSRKTKSLKWKTS